MTSTTPDSNLRVPNPRLRHQFQRREDLADIPVEGGIRDQMSIAEVLAVLPPYPLSTPGRVLQGGSEKAARVILQRLDSYPSSGWQEKWVASGSDTGLAWLDALTDPDDPRQEKGKRDEMKRGLVRLFLGRIVFPGYGFLANYQATNLYSIVRAAFRPDLFARFEERADALAANANQRKQAMVVATQIVLHTGRDLHELNPNDLLAYRAWHFLHRGSNPRTAHLAWSALAGIADLDGHQTLDMAIRRGQRKTEELVDGYGIEQSAVREVLIRYLNERRPGTDYNSFASLVANVVGRFWSDIERHNPGLDTLDIPRDAAEAWKLRLSVIVNDAGETRPRRDYFSTLMTVRGMYRDIQEWATDDPTWAQWSFPSPVRKQDTRGYHKVRAQATAEIHQRIRERLPHLPILIAAAARRKSETAAILAATLSTPIGENFEHAGHSYRRTIPKSFDKTSYGHEAPPVQVEDLHTGKVIAVGKDEHEAFWAWSVMEILRHTGIRVEELLEITHLAITSYQLPETGEVVPMLQIVPSKNNEERLLLISPELASVLATIISRLRADNDGAIPLTPRYDHYERVFGPRLPHLFQHRHGWSWSVPSPASVQKWLDQIVAHAGVTDAVGEALRYTAHDFRRMFATESVGVGLPVHIVSKLLGHKNISTTQAYTAVFDEELVRSYRAFLDARRAVRPDGEYREPTEEEWREFHQHFEHRKLELGTCGRPYGTPCKHEHACIRCPSLHVDPRSRQRLVEIAANLRDRIDEARSSGWTGEVEGLTISLNAAAAKIATLDRLRDRSGSGSRSVTGLGIPVIRDLHS